MKNRKRPQAPAHTWAPFRADERPLRRFSPHGEHSLALAYANSYHVAMSSLGFQRTYELVHDQPGWSCERFFTDGSAAPLSVETDSPLGNFRAVAFSVSFEQDYIHLLQMLDRAGIPLRRSQRTPWHPLVILGGSCAAINPLPMADFVDIFALGAAENLLPELLGALESEANHGAVLERLAATPGFFVPQHHDPEGQSLGAGGASAPRAKLDKLELSAEQMRAPGHLPLSAIVTPRTEFANKALIEMSRGCPEKCRYCWATFGMGLFRWHPTKYILAAIERARAVTDQVGFVATAVGDHPEIEKILWHANDLGMRAAVSSIRIPAVTEGVLSALHASGDRSITLAPETGSDSLRAKMGKPLTNALLLDKIHRIFAAGFTQLKLYFIVGLPGETMADVQAILDLAEEARQLMLAVAAKTGVIGHLHLGTNVLVPKPYTPWQREPMDDERSLKKKITLLKKGVAKMANVSLGSVSVRQAVWQTFISRAGTGASEPIEKMARGISLSQVLRTYEEQIRPEVFERFEGHCRWHFMQQRTSTVSKQAAS